MAETTQTFARTCHICEANCGVLITMEGRKTLSVKGNPDHVLSRGFICPKATAIPDLQDDPDRLRAPLKRGENGWEEISWEEAFSQIAARLEQVKADDKMPAVYLGNPIVHNYAISLQMRSFVKALGVRGVYSASTLDQLPHMVMQKYVYGHNGLFPVADIDNTDYMVIVGGNPMASNGSLWTVPDVRKRIKALQARGGALVVIDPRKTETAKIADAHHFIRPSTDTAFFLAILLALKQLGLVKPGRLEPMLDAGWAQIWEQISGFDSEALSAHCAVSAKGITAIASRLGNGKPAIMYGRMGVSVTRFGTLNTYLIQLINIATGNLDRVGGMLFASPAIDAVVTTSSGRFGRYHARLSGRPEILGEFPTAELAQEISVPGTGQIGALFTVAGNPVLSAPGGTLLDAALETLDLMVSIDMYVTETTRHADYILPPCGPLEKDHFSLAFAALAVRNFTCYSEAILPMEDGAKADWEIMASLVEALCARSGKTAPDLITPQKALDFMLKNGPRKLTLEQVKAAPNGLDFGPLEPRLPQRLQTEDKKIHCAPPQCVGDLDAFRETLLSAEKGQLTVIGRRHVRSNNSWLHNSRRLLKGPNRCTLMIHPDDAIKYDLASGDMARVTSRVGSVDIPTEISEDMMVGTVSIPHGYGHGREGVKLSVASSAPGVSLNDLTDPAHIDVLSGNAVLNGTPVTIARI